MTQLHCITLQLAMGEYAIVFPAKIACMYPNPETGATHVCFSAHPKDYMAVKESPQEIINLIISSITPRP